MTKRRDDMAAFCAARPVSIWFATDLHYLPARLNDCGAAFQAAMAAGDGKATEYIEQITDAFTAQVIAQKPELLILGGDLTYNGALESHHDLIAKLTAIRAAGVPILVIPGNHDLNNCNAARFSGGAAEPLRSMTAAEFAADYAPFGPAQAVSRDSSSLSYCYAVRPDLWILMLDANSAGINTLPDSTLSWVGSSLQQASALGIRVVAVSHQNLLAHNPLYVAGFQLDRADALQRLYAAHGVLCNLSGHMHLQHIRPAETPEIVTSALTLHPVQYGALQFDGTTLEYRAQSLDVAGWARANGYADERLLSFAAHARCVLERSERTQIRQALSAFSVSAGDRLLLEDTFVCLNTGFFAGDELDLALLAEGLRLWAAQPASFHGRYIDSIVQDRRSRPGASHRQYRSSPDRT